MRAPHCGPLLCGLRGVCVTQANHTSCVFSGVCATHTSCVFSGVCATQANHTSCVFIVCLFVCLSVCAPRRAARRAVRQVCARVCAGAMRRASYGVVVHPVARRAACVGPLPGGCGANRGTSESSAAGAWVDGSPGGAFSSRRLLAREAAYAESRCRSREEQIRGARMEAVEAACGTCACMQVAET